MASARLWTGRSNQTDRLRVPPESGFSAVCGLIIKTRRLLELNTEHHARTEVRNGRRIFRVLIRVGITVLRSGVDVGIIGVIGSVVPIDGGARVVVNT